MSEQQRREFLRTAGTAALGSAAGIGTLAWSSSALAQDGAAKKRKIIGISGSHRVGKTCAQALGIVLDAVKNADSTFETELVELASLKIGMMVVEGTQEPDDINTLFEKITDPSCAGLVIASPVYNGLPSARLVAMVSRLQPLRRTWALKNKIIGLVAVASARNGGQETILQGMMKSFVAQQMILAVDGVPSSHWGATLWNQKDSIMEDEYGIGTAKNLGARVAELAKLV
jgi:multimeric flavodoxin WrbA